MYRFLENFETGIPFIDNGHRRLLEDMEEAREALAAGHEDDYHRLSGQILATMHDHIVKQHVYEEEIMTMSRDGELADQKEAHTHFREVIDQHKSSMNFQNDHEELTSLLNFLNEWFLQHILSSDMLIGSALRKAKAAAVEAKARAAKEARAAEAAHAEEAAKTREAADEVAKEGQATTAADGDVKAGSGEEEPALQPTEAFAAPAKKVTKKRAAAKKQASVATPAAESGKDEAPAAKAAEPAEKVKKNVEGKPTEKKAAAPASAAEPAAKATAPKTAKPTTTVIKAKKAPADPFAFTDEFHTQIPLVDKEHETLFNLVRQTYELVHDEFRVDKFDDIIEIIEELRDYTIKHFADEERYMKSINYDGLPEQVAAHTAFVEKLNNIDFDEIDRDQEDALDKLIKFLLNWLVQHILKVDKKMPYIEEAASKLME
ncbi:hemerythrin family protein [uncultured Selenomonas sp.]|uniref:bacteriohemerythrin n=1 Tax=uncultured Selenomonas sp. TaxID=159275 RepID=UPI0028D1C745|nr:hemerythrin family protein [uncultured Selenomonas sp.]